MPQLSITPAVSPQSSAGASQTSAAAASAAEGGDGLESAPGLDFGAVLTKQLKGVASLREQKEDAGLSLAAAKESPEPAANSGAAVLPIDLSVLTASMFVPAPPIQAGGAAEAAAGKPLMHHDSKVRVDGANISAEGGVEKPLMQLPKTGEVRLAAEIAATGKNLPQAVLPEQRFADKLAALVEAPAGDAAREAHSTDLSLAANPSAAAAVFQNSEPLPALPVTPRVGSTEWGGAVGEKIVWMANQSHQVAELHLNPPNLGPLEVRLTISNDQASALFVSHHSAVREAIETALPRLREMLADNGIMLGNVTVGSESFSQQQASDQGGGKKDGGGRLEAESIMARMAVPGRSSGPVRDGMVDIFA